MQFHVINVFKFLITGLVSGHYYTVIDSMVNILLLRKILPLKDNVKTYIGLESLAICVVCNLK